MSKILNMDVRALKVRCFCVAILLYGGLGSPTPDQPGVLELVIGAFLIVGIGVAGALRSFQFDASAPFWRFSGQVLLIFGMSAGVLSGVLHGHDMGALFRDVVPFLFMMLPLFIDGLFQQRGRLLLYSVLALGVLFSIRAGFDLPYLGADEKLFYLANMPSVLFAALFFAGCGLQVFIKRFNLTGALGAMVLIALSGVCLFPIIDVQQRASVGVFALSMLTILAFYLWKHPRRVALLLVGMTMIFLFFFAKVSDVFEALNRKTELVGLNMRTQEWTAVWDEVSVHPISLIIGKGWGATFSSPAVADIQVNFTHGLLSSLLLKTGLVGLALGAFYIGALLYAIALRGRSGPVLALALAGPILIDTMLYASFKSLDFGLVLALTPALLYADRQAKEKN